MTFVVTREASFLKDLHCYCGKPAEVAWYLPPAKLGPKKMSKTDDGPVVQPQPYAYGRSCEEHIPPGIE